MNAFHMYWNPSLNEREFNDFTLLTMILSAMQWKELHGRKPSFYGDSKTVEFLERLHLSGLWEKCDGTLLDRMIDRQHYNVSVFYSIGKFIALLCESCPCVMLDMDLIIWDRLNSFLSGKDVVFTHWENTEVPSVWYCEKEKLPIPGGYQFHSGWDFQRNAANTSFIYFNDGSLKDYYVECAMRYMRDNPCTAKTAGNPAVLFAEQRLLTMCIDEKGDWTRAASLIDISWNAKKGKFQLPKTFSDGWDFFQPDNGSIATHTWIAKAQMEKNKGYRAYFCCRLIEKIRELDMHMEETIATFPSIQPYLKLLDFYDTTDRMLQKGIVTKELYGI